MLNQIIQQQAINEGRREALVLGHQRYTFAQVQEEAARFAAGLRQSGADDERGVALLLRNSPEFVFTFLAASHLGIPALLLDPESKPRELRRMFAENAPAVVVCEQEGVATLEQAREELGQQFRIFARADECSGLRSGTTEPPPARIYDREFAIVQYTSGSTGVPKCIARSYRNLFWEAKDFNETTRLDADDRILCVIPLFHAHGFGNALLAALYSGASLVLLEEFNRAAVVEALARERITVFPGVPLIFDLLARYVRGEPNPPTNVLRLVFSAGAPLPAALARQFKEQFGVYARQLYGGTELGSASINLDPDPEAKLESVGLPMKNVRIDLLRDDGSFAPISELGEIAMQSPAMPSGYFRQPELTREKFRDGFFRPGDFGRKDADGDLYIVGRTPWLISSAGRKVDPVEVETMIAAYPKVREVVVVGVPGYLGEQVVKAVVVPQETCQEHEIVDFCRDKLADFKIPRLVEFVAEIPRSASGKILRKELVS